MKIDRRRPVTSLNNVRWKPMAVPADRAKALEAALSQIDRQFGKGSVMRLGGEGRVHTEGIPTESIALDVAVGIGGAPRRRGVVAQWAESAGQTSRGRAA